MGLLLRRHHDGPADATAESADAVATSADKPEPPNKSANKPEWEAYAVAQGMSAEDADKATKAALIDQYGGDA